MKRFLFMVIALALFSPLVAAQERPYEAIERSVIDEMRTILEKRKELEAEKRQAAGEERSVSEAKSSGNVLGRLFLRGRMEALHERMTRIGRIEQDLSAREKRLDGLYAEGKEAIRRSGNDAERAKRFEMITEREIRRLEALLAMMAERIERASAPQERESLQTEKTRTEAELAEARRAFSSFYEVTR